ncbi:MAG: L,D-transpeptidase, partial [Chloroflexota bacterium]
EKARYLRQTAPKVDDDKTIPFIVEPRSRAKPKPPQIPIRQPHQIASKTAKKNAQADADFNGSSLLRWSAIFAVGLALGILAIIFINQFFGGNQPAEAQSSSEAEMVAAVFDETSNFDSDSAQNSPQAEKPTATPEPTENVDPNDEAILPTLPPTNTPEPTLQQLAAKDVNEEGESRSPWTPTPTPTPTNTPTPTIEPTRLTTQNTSFAMPNVGISERWVDVNLTLQTLTAYEGNSPVYQTIISSGRPPYYTVTGQFRVYYRLESQTMDGRRLGFDYVTPGVPHVQYFYGDFAIHGAYWHDDFGTPVSHGCVNVTPTDAEWLYNWMSYGTLVNVHY